MSTSWWCNRKDQGFINDIGVIHLSTIDICTIQQLLTYISLDQQNMLWARLKTRAKQLYPPTLNLVNPPHHTSTSWKICLIKVFLNTWGLKSVEQSGSFPFGRRPISKCPKTQGAVCHFWISVDHMLLLCKPQIKFLPTFVLPHEVVARDSSRVQKAGHDYL